VRTGPLKHAPSGADITFGRYAEGGVAIVLQQSGERYAVASVNLTPYGSRPLKPDEVWLKNWSGNEDIPDALVAAGAIMLTGETMANGLVVAQLAVLTDAAKEALAAQEAGE
jgi:hypothetical protein